jgi:hypothetical protein
VQNLGAAERARKARRLDQLRKEQRAFLEKPQAHPAHRRDVHGEFVSIMGCGEGLLADQPSLELLVPSRHHS